MPLLFWEVYPMNWVDLANADPWHTKWPWLRCPRQCQASDLLLEPMCRAMGISVASHLSKSFVSTLVQLRTIVFLLSPHCLPISKPFPTSLPLASACPRLDKTLSPMSHSTVSRL